MKRIFASLFLLALATAPAVAEEPRLSPTAEYAAAETVTTTDEGVSLRLPADRDRLDWQWQGEFDYGEEGERLVLGSGLSFATSPYFAVGGSYALALRPYARLPNDVDPARYTVFMRLRF